MTDYVAQELATAFAASAGNHFAALERDYRLVRSLETQVYDAQGHRPVDPTEVGDRFFGMRLTLTGPTVEIVVTYGDREHNMNCLVRPATFSQPFALWEWLLAMADTTALDDNGEWVLSPERIDSLLRMYDEVLNRTLAGIVGDGDALAHGLKAHRQQRLDGERLQMAESEHRRLAARAAEAFHRKDYRLVVETLSAVQVDLTASELRHLEYARGQLEAKPSRI